MKHAALLALVLFASACNDPAKDKTRAETGEAKRAQAAPADGDDVVIKLTIRSHPKS